MSRNAKVEAPFGDGVKIFRLGIGQLEELQEACDAGPEELFYRILGGTWRVRDIREPIRIGLIGGGTPPMKALALVERYAGEGQLGELKELVTVILGAAINGAPDEDKPPAGEPTGEPNLSPAES